MSFVTLILGFFGIDMKKKSVTFADEAEKKDETKAEDSSNSLDVVATESA
jgi:hypothetical protein